METMAKRKLYGLIFTTAAFATLFFYQNCGPNYKFSVVEAASTKDGDDRQGMLVSGANIVRTDELQTGLSSNKPPMKVVLVVDNS